MVKLIYNFSIQLYWLFHINSLKLFYHKGVNKATPILNEGVLKFQ